MILIRHSIPEQLPSVPSSEWQLSAVGRARCASLARELEPFQPDAIFSSVERKAAETAQLIAQHFGLQVVQLRELAEHDRSNVPYFASQEEFEEHLQRFFQEPQRQVFGRESAVKALSRFERGIDVVRAAGATQPLVVSHGTVMSLCIARTRQLDPWQVWKKLKMASYVVLD